MKLITEIHEETLGIIVESKQGEKKYFFEGICIQAGIPNRNGRIYPVPMMEAEVARFITEKVESDQAVGELGHPATPTINYDRVSHKHVSLVREGNNWVGKAKVLTALPMGKIIAGLIDEGIKFGTSTRGIGNLNKKSNITEVSNYKMATVGDVVSDPSGPDCFVRGVMEGAEFVYDAASDSFTTLKAIEDIQNTFKHTAYSKINEELKLAAFNHFLKTL